MLLVETQLTTKPAFDAASKLRLRIRSDDTTHLVELRQGKTTIGSSPRCAIRIVRPGVQPLHCLILCENGNVSVRRWAAGTRLNGQAFDEAPLGLGDRLAIGDAELELEIVESDLAAEKVENPSSEGAVSAAGESLTDPPAPSSESWGEWSSTRVTQLSDERQNAAFPQSVGATRSDPADQAARPEPWGAQSDGADQSIGRLTILHEHLSQLEVTLASWKGAREDWQQECAEWRAEREQAHLQWCELERQIAELQSRASEIIGRIERLEHSMAAQALVPKFEALRVELQHSVSQTESLVESPTTFEPASKSFSSFEDPAISEVDAVSDPKPETEDELAPFAEFSIWRQGAVREEPRGAESQAINYPIAPYADTQVSQSDSRATPAVDNSWPIAPAKSFIEQYGHMFADDGAETEIPSAATSLPAPTDAVADNDSLIRTPRNPRDVQPEGDVTSASTDDEEESIEQYMLKLLQRVRGDRPDAGAMQSAEVDVQSTGSLLPPGFQPSATYSAAISGPAAQPSVTTNELTRLAGNGDWLTSLGTVRRKAPIVEQPADMKTLRAVANESARRAIGTHGLRVHRRNAITKVIVSTLAGMTSLLMMLGAPHWKDLQFITACVSLIVAAYWAGQTYAELIDAFRFAAYDGPEDQLQGFANPLPAESSIDVNNLAKS
ncbi:MAG TPA: FHA domain-containing protein [Lacipirellulaceae bacterium]|nr:FHA domain-containing protein [Lacipirellulaceae bacterium]